MKWILRDVRDFLAEYGVSIVVVLLLWAAASVVATVVGDQIKQVITDIHTIAESIEKSD